MITANQIIITTAQEFGIDPEFLAGGSAAAKYSTPRQIAYHLLAKKLNMSTPKIGEFLGGRHHTTVIHGLQKMEQDRASNAELDGVIKRLEIRVDLISRFENFTVLDVIALAQHASISNRAAMGLSTNQIMAMAAALVEIWEIASAAGAMLQLIDEDGEPAEISEIGDAIKNAMQLITETKEHDDAKRH